ncbi:hypothetical protein A2160_01015 [Candidatus Beckwithbacteria bacterium RBG_13_42_9]|uniref:Probable zinc-binding domain-containing protein n=1 Tax=Candidatus Beckwithbacteria bacterium RBG_13_42_9 TaxID=1797457 RepID=A0A1F5E829_9BACT|nr:MAG: hypothetical protein A2160_01015 [Candidatus Beckwithbacteria bacterium RBG_13_42_9]
MRQDMIIRCQQCGQQFVWTQEEQQFYQERGLSVPTHCPICRATLKAAQADQFRGKIKNKSI